MFGILWVWLVCSPEFGPLSCATGKAAVTFLQIDRESNGAEWNLCWSRTADRIQNLLQFAEYTTRQTRLIIQSNKQTKFVQIANETSNAYTHSSADLYSQIDCQTASSRNRLVGWNFFVPSKSINKRISSAIRILNGKLMVYLPKIEINGKGTPRRAFMKRKSNGFLRTDWFAIEPDHLWRDF